MKKNLTLRLFAIAVMIFLLAAEAATAETLVFSDSFQNGLGNWKVGCNTAMYSSPMLTVEDGKAAWHQGWDYIETLQSFNGNFRVEVDIERGSDSVQCKDFSIELVNVPSFAGAFRFQYGTYRKDSILLGDAPDYTTRSPQYTGECIQHSTSPYLREIDTVTGNVHTGTLSLIYSSGQLILAYRNSKGQTIQTPAANVGDLGDVKIRIAATSNKAHFVDAVRVYSLDDNPAGDCASANLENLNIDIPCIMIGGRKYQLRMLYDPNIQGGYYWKLDLNSLREAQ